MVPYVQRLYKFNMNTGSFIRQEAFRIRRIPWVFKSVQEREKYRNKIYICGKTTCRGTVSSPLPWRVLREPPMCCALHLLLRLPSLPRLQLVSTILSVFWHLWCFLTHLWISRDTGSSSGVDLSLILLCDHTLVSPFILLLLHLCI